MPLVADTMADSYGHPHDCLFTVMAFTISLTVLLFVQAMEMAEMAHEEAKLATKPETVV